MARASIQIKPWNAVAIVSCLVMIGCGFDARQPNQTDEWRWVSPNVAQGFGWLLGPEGEEALVLRHPQTGELAQTILKGDASIPPGHDKDKVVRIDASRGVVTTSTTHVHLLKAVSGLEHWLGGNSIQYVRDSVALSMIADGEAIDVSGDPVINAELLLPLNPGWVSSMPHQDIPAHWQVPVVTILEYLEPHPLGRAEWMRAFAWMTNSMAQGDSTFDALRASYEAAICHEPRHFPMFTGSVADGVWHAPGKHSFVAQWIEDAGAQYMLEGGKEGANIEVGLERLLALADSAKAWVVVTYHPDDYTLADLIKEDPRHEQIASITEAIWVCNTAKADYFGELVVHPDWMVEDMRALLEGARTGPHGLIKRMTETP